MLEWKTSKSLTALQSRLDQANVTDACVRHLAELTQLQRLDLTGTKVTAEGVAKLQQALPNCEIIR